MSGDGKIGLRFVAEAPKQHHVKMRNLRHADAYFAKIFNLITYDESPSNVRRKKIIKK